MEILKITKTKQKRKKVYNLNNSKTKNMFSI